MAEVEIYSAAVCPFAHRARLTLLEKGVDFEVHEIDLAHKPSWFGEVSPFGKVPVVVRGEDRVWESSVVNEYLNEVYPEPRLLPTEPGPRARARIWIEYANSQFVPAFSRLLTEREPERQGERADELLGVMEFMETRGLAENGADPYWFGREVSLADLTFYPWFERWPVLEHYRGVRFPARLERLSRWRGAMEARDSVRAGRQSAAFYIEGYERYARPRD